MVTQKQYNKINFTGNLARGGNFHYSRNKKTKLDFSDKTVKEL